MSNTGFCEVHKLSEGFLACWSEEVTRGGQSSIMKISNDQNSVSPKQLYHRNDATLSHFNRYDSCWGFVQEDFDSNTINSSIFLSTNNGLNWNMLESSFINARNFFVLDSIIIMEGNVLGTGQAGVFKSEDLGITWQKIQYQNYNYKNLILNEKMDEFIICTASRDFYDKQSVIVLLNMTDGKLTEIKKIKNQKYFRLISNIKNSFATIDENTISVFKIENNSMNQLNKIKLPDNISLIQNIYVDSNYCIITAINKGKYSKYLSWISWTNGQYWDILGGNLQYELVYNNFGALIMKDDDNNVLIDSISNSNN